MPQGNFTGSGIGQTVGRYGLGAFGGLVGGLPGAFIGSKIGGPLGGLVGGGLSSLFGPHGLQAAFGQQGLGSLFGQQRGISMLINRGGQLPASVSPTAGVTQSAGGWPIDANGNLVTPRAAAPMGAQHALTHTTGIPGYASAAIAGIKAHTTI